MICDSKLAHDPHHFQEQTGTYSEVWLYCEGRTAPAPPRPVMGQADFWEPTHFSASDGSPIRVIFRYLDDRTDTQMFVCENECGDQWTDPANLWEEAT